jgi:L,D-transpeptidase ErfK/SrfK
MRSILKRMPPAVERARLVAVAIGVVTAIGTCRAEAADARQRVIGTPSIYIARYEDTLMDIARGADVGFVEIRAANPTVDPWLPGAGTRIVLPTQHVLPDVPHRGIVINLAELRLYYFPPAGGRPSPFQSALATRERRLQLGIRR